MSDPVSRLNAALEGRYSIEREVGAGGMATVYLAEDVRHHRKVALKVLRPDLAATLGPERFLREIEIAAGLTHPHILPLHDSGEADGFLFYVLPYVEGESLRDRLVREGELPVDEAVRILRDVVDALAHAHDHGVVHRDIKPDNVMLSGRHALVTDFGVAKAVSEATGRHQLTTVGVALGTPAYMAPEQAEVSDHIDHRADIYAVGALAYELLAGAPPFAGKSPQMVLLAQVTQAPEPVTEHRSTVPAPLSQLVMRCLEKKPADRWQTAEEMLAHLEAVATPSGGLTPTQMQPVTVASGRRSWLPWAAVTAVGLMVALVTVVIPRVSDGEPGAVAVLEDADGPERLIVVPLQSLVDDEEVELWGQLAADQIARSIDQPRPVDVIPASAVRDAMRRLGGSASTADLARETGATHAVAGTVSRIGEQARFEIEILDQRTGQLLRALDPVTGPVDSVEIVIGRVAAAATGAAVALLDPEAPVWLGDFTAPPSLGVYRDYLTLSDRFARGDYRGAIELGDRISRTAPDYAPALSMAYTAHSNLGQQREADSLHAIMTPLRDRMTTEERAAFDWVSAGRDGDPGAATRAAEELYRLDPASWGYVAGLTARRTGLLEAAVERFLAYDTETDDFGRNWFPWRSNLAQTYHMLGRYEDELALARAEFANFPGDQRLHDYEMRALVALGRVEEADSILRLVQDLPPQQGLDRLFRPVWLGLELRAHGYEEESEAIFAEAIPPYVARGSGSQNNRGRTYFYARRWEDADTVFASRHAAAPDNLNDMGYHGVILAMLGRREEALRISDQLGQMERSALRGDRIAWQAGIAAALGDRDEAVRLAQSAFDNGWAYALALHREPSFESLRGYPPWEALVAPR